MAEHTIQTHWGVTGILWPWAILDASGEVVSHGAMKIGFDYGMNPADLGKMTEKTEQQIFPKLRDSVLNVYGPLAKGETFESITIEEHQQLEREDADRDKDDECEPAE